MIYDQELLVAYGGEVKSLEEGKLEGIGIVFGSPDKPDRSEYKDFFDSTTSVNPSDTFITHLAFEHGRGRAEPIGIATMTKTAIGWNVEADLNLEDPFVKAIFPDIKKGKYGFSTGAVSHLVKRNPQSNGTNHIKQWFVGELSITTRPAEEAALITSVKFLPEERESTMTAEEILKDIAKSWFEKFNTIDISEQSLDKIVEKLSSVKADNSELASLQEQLATKTQELADLEGKLQIGEDALKEANDQITRVSLLAGIETVLKDSK